VEEFFHILGKFCKNMSEIVRGNGLNLNKENQGKPEEIFSFENIDKWNEQAYKAIFTIINYPNYSLGRFANLLYLNDRTFESKFYKVTSNLRDLSFISFLSKDELTLIFESYEEFKKRKGIT